MFATKHADESTGEDQKRTRDAIRAIESDFKGKRGLRAIIRSDDIGDVGQGAIRADGPIRKDGRAVGKSDTRGVP